MIGSYAIPIFHRPPWYGSAPVSRLRFERQIRISESQDGQASISNLFEHLRYALGFEHAPNQLVFRRSRDFDRWPVFGSVAAARRHLLDTIRSAPDRVTAGSDVGDVECYYWFGGRGRYMYATIFDLTCTDDIIEAAPGMFGVIVSVVPGDPDIPIPEPGYLQDYEASRLNAILDVTRSPERTIRDVAWFGASR